MADTSPETVREIAALVGAASKPLQVQSGNTDFILVPDGYSLESLARFRYNEYADRPQRVEQAVRVLDAESFVEYYTLFSDENSRAFAWEPESKVVAVLDYHAARDGAARWGKHRLTLELRLSPEWSRWLGMNNKQFNQTQFAEFLEQNGIDITNPTPAAMMEVARDLKATTDVEFSAGVSMNNGQRKFKYTETMRASVGAGELSVPEQFTVTIPAYIGGDRVPMQALLALLRFRVNEGKLVIWYTLIRPEEVLRSAFIASRDRIANELKITIINGTPAA